MNQLDVRHRLQMAIGDMDGDVYGAGTDLTTGVMDISFEIEGKVYRIKLKQLKKRDRKVSR